MAEPLRAKVEEIARFEDLERPDSGRASVSLASRVIPVLLGGFVAGWWLGRFRSKRKEPPERKLEAVRKTQPGEPPARRRFGIPEGEEDTVDRSSRESFPASDPPAW